MYKLFIISCLVLNIVRINEKIYKFFLKKI